MIRIYQRFSLIWNTLWLATIFWLLAWVFPLIVVREISYDFSLLIMVGVFGTWIVDVFYIYKENDTRPSSMLILAMFLVSFVLLQSRILAVANFYLEYPNWLMNSPWGAWIAFQAAVIGILQVWAVAKTKGALETFHRNGIIVSVAITAFILGVLFTKYGPLVNL